MAKTITARMSQKHDLEVNWANIKFIPKQGEIIIYDIEVDKDGNILALPSNRTTPYTYERLKIGDGISDISDLPFYVVESDSLIFDEDIIITTEVGNIKLENGSGIIPAKGKTIKQVFEAIWTEE